MKISFTKMHGAGNDFILIDDRELTTPWEDYPLMAALAARRTGIGCEGIIILQKSEIADFKMRFLNPDGTEVELCGNGTRCVASYANKLGIVNRSMTIETMVGLIDAEIVNDKAVRLWMPDPTERRYNLSINVNDKEYIGHAINVGCPHVVIPISLEELSTLDIDTIGAAIRQHDMFAPEGINVDFVAYSQPNRIRMRTYERGVEGESGACGTGAVASAIVGVELAEISLPSKILVTSGFELTVDGDWRTNKCTRMTLVGPVQFVYEGSINLEDLDTEQQID